MALILESAVSEPDFFIVAAAVLGFFFTVTAFMCWINTLSPAFERSLIWGALCFVPPIAFLWGWAKAAENKQKANMLVWSVCVIPMIAFLIFLPNISESVNESLVEGMKHIHE